MSLKNVIHVWISISFIHEIHVHWNFIINFLNQLNLINQIKICFVQTVKRLNLASKCQILHMFFDPKSDFLNYSVIDSHNLSLDRDIRGSLPWFVARYDHLEYTYTGPSFSFPVLRIRIKSLQHIKGLGSIVKLSHLQRIKFYYDFFQFDAHLLKQFFDQSIEKHVATNWLHCKFEYLYAILWIKTIKWMPYVQSYTIC